jgi:hypothetical protein
MLLERGRIGALIWRMPADMGKMSLTEGGMTSTAANGSGGKSGSGSKLSHTIEGVLSGASVTQEVDVTTDRRMKDIVAVDAIKQIICGTNGGLTAVDAELAELKTGWRHTTRMRLLKSQA